MEHKKLSSYLNGIRESRFNALIGESGGYIKFQNSGQRGSVKEFTLSIESILSGIMDILENLSVFQRITEYSEGEWRDAGARYFSDVSLSSIITVQTKPTFTTFSKLICWANDIDYIGDNKIIIDEEYLKNTEIKLQELIKSYRPKEKITPKKLPNSISYIPKPFLLLAGLSGTGKTRFVREQAESKETYCPVPVRPDWHEPSDLLGYVSRLSGKPEYVSTKVLEFIIRAWKAVAPNADSQGTGELNLDVEPYWLCLDEMNLAPVEQYFADYLSVLESRRFRDGKYECDALLDSALLKNLKIMGGNPQKDLGLKENDDLWGYFVEFGIGIPPNLIVAGTVNMDETTHGFSRKVIDRAFTFDFGEFFPNDYAQFFTPQTQPVTFTYPLLTQAEQGDLVNTVDSDGNKTIHFLESVNGLLKSTPFELAYRALNELLLQVVCFNPQSLAELQSVWDDFLMSKVLPRIDGDEDKLTIKKDDEAKNLLKELAVLLQGELGEIWDGERKDFYRVNTDGSDIASIECRSKTKLAWMSDRLEVNTFTSFWP